MMRLTLFTVVVSLVLSAKGELPFILTSDVEGRLLICPQCSASAGFPGIARWKTAVDSLREAHPDVLLLDAGNALMGGDSSLSRGDSAAKALRHLGVDVFNISHRDFRYGAERLREVVADNELTAVSANTVSAENSDRLFPAYQVVRGTTVTGLTEAPAGRAYLPHLRKQLEGVEILDPAETMRTLIPELPEEGPLVLLLYGGGTTADRLAEILSEAFPGRQICIGISGRPPGKVVDGVEIFSADSSGKTLTVSLLDEPMEVTDPEEDPETAAWLRRILTEQAVVEERRSSKEKPVGLTEPKTEFSQPMRGGNRGFSVSVFGVERVDELRGRGAKDGSRWLILDTRFENDQAIELRLELEYPETLLPGPLTRQLFVVVNGTHARPAMVPEDARAGWLPDSMRLPHSGSNVRGRVAFEVPDEEIRSLSLHYYHDLFPPLRVDLVESNTATESGTPFHGVSENQVEVWIRDVEQTDEVEGRSAPEGMRWLVMELRGLGRRMDEIDALAAERGAPADRKTPNARVTDYLKADALLQVVVNGRDAYVRDPVLSELPKEPSFLPDIRTGGRMVFPVPRDAESLELLLDFPEFRGAAGASHPDPVRLVLSGDPDSVPEPEVTARLKDDPLPLTLHPVEILESHPAFPNAEKRVLKVPVSIENHSETGGMYEPLARARLLPSVGEAVEPIGVVLEGGIQAPEQMWIPAHRRPRRFSYLFVLPEDVEPGQFSYNGVSRAGVFDLMTGRMSETQEVKDSVPIKTMKSGSSAAQGGGFELTRYAGPEEAPPVEFTPAVYSETLESTPAESRIELGVSGKNERVKITADHAYVFTQNEKGKWPEDEKMVGVHLRIERLEGHTDPVSIRFLKEDLFAVSRLATLQLLVSDNSLNTQIPHRFELKDGGEAVEGLALFKVPSAQLTHFELHWLDEEFGNMELPVFPAGKERMESPEAHFKGGNRLAELGVVGMELRESYGDLPLENGSWLVMDLRGRSLRRTPESDQGIGGVGTRLGWRDWMLRSQLIVNGNQIFDLNRHQTDIEDPFLMIPGRTTGGEIAFGIPDEVLASAESIEFVAGFGACAVPGERVSTPKPVRIQLKGDRPKISLPEASQAVVEDVDFDLYLARTERVEEFMGSTTRAGEWVVADLYIRAKAEQGVFFTPNDRVQLVNGKNESVQLQSVVWGGDLASSPRGSGQWIAPGDVRRVRMAWAPKNQREPHRIRYAGMRRYQLFPVGDDGEQEADPSGDSEKNTLISERGLQVLYPDREPKGITGVDLEPEQVNSAIDRGRAYLWEEIQEEAAGRGGIHRMNYIYPMLYALVNTDLHMQNTEFDGVLRDFLDRVRPDEQTIYENGLLAMILRAYGDPDYADLLRQTVHYFVEAQGENGTWSYRAETPERFFVREEPVESDDGLLIAGGENPEAAAERLKEPVYRTQSFTLGKEGDNSCTQFAVLGLWSAQRAGLKVDPDVWKRVLRSASHFQNLRNTDSFGGYTYGSGGNSYGSMSAAVLCTTAIALRQLDPDLKVTEHLRIRNALGWLAENFSVELNPNKKRYNYYYLYSLERVGQILGTEFIGDYEWYPLGARYLVDVQKKDGSWPEAPGETDPRLTTSYALLFLTRATPKMDEDLTPDPDEPGILLTRLKRPDVRNRVYLILDASGSMRDQAKGRTKFDAARQALGDMVNALPEGTEVALRVYGHRLLAVDKGAEEDSELVSGWGTLDVPAFRKTLQNLNPKGKTPLTFSLNQAAGEVTGRGAEGQTLVVLLTDGGESTRGADPVEAARAFSKKEGVQFFVLGFDINREDWTRQLQELAAAANGVYRPVEDTDLLTRELMAVVDPPAPFFTFSGEDGGPVESGTFEDGEFSMKPGKYKLTLDPGADERTQTVWIRPGGTTRIQYTLDPTRRPQSPMESLDGQPESGTDGPSFCIQCGHTLKPDSKFCTSCGQPVR